MYPIGNLSISCLFLIPSLPPCIHLSYCSESLILERFSLQELATSDSTSQEHLSDSPELINGQSEGTELQLHVTEAISSQHLHSVEENAGEFESHIHAELAHHQDDDGHSTVRASLHDSGLGAAGSSQNSSSLSKALPKLQRKRLRAEHGQTGRSRGQEERLETPATDSVGKRLCTSSYIMPEAVDDVQ